MSRFTKLRFVLPIMFGLVILLASSSPVFAESPACSISVEPQATVQTVGSTSLIRWTVPIWIRGVEEGMKSFGLIVTWDNSQLQSMAAPTLNLPESWTKLASENGVTDTGLSYYMVQAYQSIGVYSQDRYWVTLYFRCRAAGVSQIEIPTRINPTTGGSIDTYVYTTSQGPLVPFSITTSPGLANQQPSMLRLTTTTATQPVPSVPQPVGGELSTANKLAVLSPYLTLLTIVAVAAVVVKRRKI